MRTVITSDDATGALLSCTCAVDALSSEIQTGLGSMDECTRAVREECAVGAESSEKQLNAGNARTR
jgi:hypothetical protein